MNGIEKASKDYISAYNMGDNAVINLSLEKLLFEISNKKSYLEIKHMYLVLRSLFNAFYNNEVTISNTSLELFYYCLLKNYINNSNISLSDSNPEYILGCKMGISFIVANDNFIRTDILEKLGFAPDVSYEMLQNQLEIFYRDSEMSIWNHNNFIVNHAISDMLKTELLVRIIPDEILKCKREKCLSETQNIISSYELTI